MNDKTAPDPEKQAEQEGGSEAGIRSPTVSVAKAGSGRLIPFNAKGPIRPLIFFAHECTDRIQAGTLFYPDVRVSREGARECGFSNPARALILAIGAESDGVIRIGVDILLQQFLALLCITQSILDVAPEDEASRSDRTQAREHIDTLRDWANMAMVRRSGGDARVPMFVPDPIEKAAMELARIGRRLRHHRMESELERDPNTLVTKTSGPSGGYGSSEAGEASAQEAPGNAVTISGFLCAYDPTSAQHLAFAAELANRDVDGQLPALAAPSRPKGKAGRRKTSDSTADWTLVEAWRRSGKNKRDFEHSQKAKKGDVRRAQDRNKQRERRRAR